MEMSSEAPTPKSPPNSAGELPMVKLQGPDRVGPGDVIGARPHPSSGPLDRGGLEAAPRPPLSPTTEGATALRYIRPEGGRGAASTAATISAGDRLRSDLTNSAGADGVNCTFEVAAIHRSKRPEAVSSCAEASPPTVARDGRPEDRVMMRMVGSMGAILTTRLLQAQQMIAPSMTAGLLNIREGEKAASSFP